MLEVTNKSGAATLRCAEPADAPPRGTRSASRRGHVLVVEDDDSTREAVVAGLEYAGYTVVGVADGEAALDVLRRGFVPWVIVLDLMMPVMDGREFRRQQLADPALASIPVVVVSADMRGPRLAGSPGIHAALLKPVDLDELLQSIEQSSRP